MNPLKLKFVWITTKGTAHGPLLKVWGSYKEAKEYLTWEDNSAKIIGKFLREKTPKTKKEKKGNEKTR